MAQQAELTHVGEGQGEKPFWQQWKVFYAAFAQFCYVGAQGASRGINFFSSTKLNAYAVAIASYFINYVTETRGHTSSSAGAKLLAGAQGCFAVGRFSGSGASRPVSAHLKPSLTCTQQSCRTSARARSSSHI